ncbi:chemerin-like receptor 1 [Pholidichthys leucotaenia]
MGTGNVSSSASPWLMVFNKHITTVSLVFYCLIFIVGTVGNGLVIYVTGFRMKKTVNSIWFVNLALADFLFTAFMIFQIISVSQNGIWPFGNIMCKLSNFVSTHNMFASIFLLTAISLDRCLSTWVVVWAQNKRTVLKAQVICVIIWVTAGFCSTPYATFRAALTKNGTRKCGYLSMTSLQIRSLYIFRFVIGFLIPFLVILVSYVAIAIRAGRLQKKRKNRSRRIILSIILAFFICWLPYHIVSFLELTLGKDKRKIVGAVGRLTVCLGFTNSCLNPILYVFMCDEFQKKLKQSICFVLESALAEDHLSFMSTRSMTTFTKSSQKSDSVTPLGRKDTATSLNFTEIKMVVSEDTLDTE